MNPAAAKRLRLLASVISVLVVAALLFAAWFYTRLRASLPQLDGRRAVTELAAAVTVERDALGVPTIRGQNRPDVARALGWLHGQERFFQMDLMRRNAAGELAELFGAKAVPRDRAMRLHDFRRTARLVLTQLPPAERTLLEAYAAGVNAGLAALGEKPFEYLVLRTPPQPWRPEDTVLVIYAMSLDLQDGEGRYERSLMALRDQLGREALAFFAPLVTPADAALDGSAAPLPPMPGPKVLDLRQPTAALAAPPGTLHFDRVYPGSNSFALSGAHTASGAAVLANDMHLDHGVPNTWYRASLEFPGHKITGVTLPGAPVIVAGSNGHVAWGFTDAYADTTDLVIVNAIEHLLYSAPGHETSLEIEKRHETINVKGGEPVVVDYEQTIWGPLVGEDENRHPLALRWLAHEPAATNLALIGLEDATTAGEAVAVAHRAGIPAQNFLVADAAGDIAWTIVGKLPRRIGYDGRLPVNWAFGDRRWDGLVAAADIPVITTKTTGQPSETPAPTGRLWTANQRVVGGAGLALLGDGGYARPARAAQIRDDLASLERATPRDLLAVQLDDRARFLEPWQKLLLQTLTPEVVAQKKTRGELRALAEKWEGRASVDSVSYRLVHDFRAAVYQRVFPPIFQPCVDAYPAFDPSSFHLEPALWTLLKERPAHLLNPQVGNWDALLAAAADDVVTALHQEGLPLARATWGRHNVAVIVHPFSRVLPAWLTGWLNMPANSLPGDVDMPRLQRPNHGASERFVVSPGREDEGIFHMPGGQSGHPLSPFYRAGHEAWVRGEPTPFLPGKTAHTLTLTPVGGGN